MSGADDATPGDWEPCPECDGTGSRTCAECDGTGDTGADCPDCDEATRDKCTTCEGDGCCTCYACDGTGEILVTDAQRRAAAADDAADRAIDDAAERELFGEVEG